MGERAERRPRYVAVVRRGETEIYQMLKEYLESRGVAEVVWDRRIDDRPAPDADERRHGNRRSPAVQDPWGALGFFITRAGEPPPGSARGAHDAAGA